MADYLLDLSANPIARKLVRQLKLPIPLPQTLQRSERAWQEQPLQERNIVVGAFEGQEPAHSAGLSEAIRRLIKAAGGETPAAQQTSDPSQKAPENKRSHAGSDLPQTPGAIYHGLVYNAVAVQSPEQLRCAFDFLRAHIPHLAANGRVLLIAADANSQRSTAAAATSEAVGGLVRSLAKELGRKGGTAQALFLQPRDTGIEALQWPLLYFLSDHSAFVSGQVLHLSAGIEAPEATNSSIIQPLRGKVAMVTGAAQGIGADICRRFAAEGAKVVGIDRPSESSALNTLMEQIGGTAYAYDLADPATPKAIAARVAAEFGHIDIIVNNAGITRDKTLTRMPSAWWDDVLTINLSAAMRLTDLFIHGEGEMFKLMNPHGRVIMMSSIGGIAGNAGQTNYAAAKAGLIGYVKALAPQVARRGITVNAIAPGFIETRMTRAMPVAVREVARRFNSLNQAGLPQDIAEAAVFLAAPGAFALTGATLRVCGQNLIGA